MENSHHESLVDRFAVQHTPRKRAQQIKLTVASTVSVSLAARGKHVQAGRPSRPCFPRRVALAVAETTLAVSRAEREKLLAQGRLPLGPLIWECWRTRALAITGSLRWRDRAQLEANARVHRVAPRALLAAPRVAAVVVPTHSIIGEVEVCLGVRMRCLVSVKVRGMRGAFEAGG